MERLIILLTGLVVEIGATILYNPDNHTKLKSIFQIEQKDGDCD